MAETILLVEDDESLRRLAQRLLKKLGYEVVAAGNGATAEAGCRDHQGDIHLLITDVFMPDIGGLELASRLLDIRPNMKVLYVSGSAEALREGGTLAAGTNLLEKPYTQDQISQKIREVLDSSN